MDCTSRHAFCELSVSLITLSLALLLSGCGGGGNSIPIQTPTPTPNVALVSINIAPAAATIAVGATQQFTATGNYSDGTTKDLTSVAIWSSSSANAATLAASGLATGTSQGDTTIMATSNNVTGSAVLTVGQGRTVVSPVKFAYSGDLFVYTIDSSTGDVRSRGYKTSQSHDAGDSALNCLTTDPSGSFAYAINHYILSSPGYITIYSLNPTNGSATEVAGSPVATPVWFDCLNFEPTGKFGYTLSSGNQLRGFARDLSTGLLTELPWSPMTVGNWPRGLTIDPLGKYLYFVNVEYNTGKQSWIDGFSIDNTTGTLTGIPGIPVLIPTTLRSEHASIRELCLHNQFLWL